MENANLHTEKKVEDYKVPNLEKGIAVLEYLSFLSKGDTLQSIRTALDISQTTAYRILNTLTRLEYLVYADDTKMYKLSKKMLTVGFRTMHESGALEVALPHMISLRDQLQETVCFGVLGDDKGVLIEQVKGTHPFCFGLMPGKLFELHCSAPGKAIMAYLPIVVRNKYLGRMDYVVYNGRTITNQTDYLKELDEVLERGYALDNEEELTGVMCVGAPVLNYRGYPVGAIWISAPSDRINKKNVAVDIELVKQAAQRISADLGYSSTRK